MIRAMRENLKVLSVSLWIVIAAFIATTFFVWGRGSITGGDGTTAATVNGEQIPLAQYQQLYRFNLEFYQQAFSDRFTEEMARQLRLGERVMNDLILERLLLQWARKEGIGVGDQELRGQIEAMPVFHEGGQFSPDRYRRLLAFRRLDAVTFETAKRTEILRQKVEGLITDSAKVTETELREAWRLRHERLRVQYLVIETAPLIPAVQVSADDLQKYYDGHQASLRRPEQRRVLYAIFPFNAFQRAAVVADQEVEAYYRDHPKEFEQPKRIRAAHILVRVPAMGGSEAEAKARGKLEAALERVKAGADFAQLAREISEDPASAAQGGDLGFLAEGELVKSFEQVAFALKKGEVSQPVRTEFGYHLIKLLDLEQAAKKSLGEAKGTIRQKLVAERAERLAQDHAEALGKALSNGKDFRAEAERQGAQVRESPLIQRGAPLEGVGRVAEVEDAIWGLAAGGTTPPVKMSSGYLVARLVEKKDASVPPLAEVRETVLAEVRREKATEQALGRARALVPVLAKGEDLTTLARRENLRADETGFFSRAALLADRDLAGDLGQHPFSVRTGGVSEPIVGQRGVYLIKVVERQPPDPQGFETGRAGLEREILSQKRAQAWQGWLEALRARAKIEINETVLGTLAQ